jgi:hypothetical protein
MRTNKSITKHPERSVEKIICNGCGKVAKHLDCTDITPVDIDFSYGSEHDGYSWSFDLCDTCVKDIVSKFKVPVNKEQI